MRPAEIVAAAIYVAVLQLIHWRVCAWAYREIGLSDGVIGILGWLALIIAQVFVLHREGVDFAVTIIVGTCFGWEIANLVREQRRRKS